MVRIGIVGAGITGLTTAYYALKQGYDVTVYESMDRIGFGASGYNAGVIHVIQPPFNSVKSKLCLEGNRLYPGLAEEIGFKIRFMKAYLVYKGLIKYPISIFASIYLRRRGYKVRYVDKNVIRSGCKDVSRDVSGGLEVEGYAVVDPNEVLNKLYNYLIKHGVDIRLGDKVDSFSLNRGKISIYSRDEAEYDYVVVAAGASTRELCRYIDVNPPTQRFAKGVMTITKLDCDNIIARLELTSRNKYTKGGAVIPRVDEETVLFGPTFKWTSDPYDNSVYKHEAEDTVKAYRDLVDVDPEIISAYAGTRVINWPDDDFIIKFLYDRVAILYGIDSPGFTAAPAISMKILERFGLKSR